MDRLVLFKRIRVWSIYLAGLAALTGCSAHPGAGTWIPVAGSDTEYSRIEVRFEGRAEFFLPGRDEAKLRCFWAGDSRNSIALQCTAASNPDEELYYRLRTMGPDSAELLRGEQHLLLLRRSE